ncbi:MAG: TIGR00303 family protein [Phormidesmis sp.]
MIHLCAGNPGDWLARHRGKQPIFACVLSFTETGLIPHISAAGMTPQARQYTALADAEFLFSGAASERYPLPPLAAGVSPAVISRAILTRQAIPLYLLSTGLPDRLTVPHIQLPVVIAKAVQTGQAMTLDQASRLLQSGLQWGQRLSHPDRYLIIGECVVGGTTTAQAVLSALGYAVSGRMGSSHRRANHSQKQALVEQGLAVWRQCGDLSSLAAAAAVGDPMQLVAAGMLLAASAQGGVLLAGGAQMLAVYALAQAIAQCQQLSWHPTQVVVGTTRWVIEDQSADTVVIAQTIGVPYLASQIDFSQSPYAQLRAYERGFVKEGMGAGGCAIAAHLYRGWTQTQLRHAVEAELRRCL